MESGWLPWRQQKITDQPVVIDYSKSLPPPPRGQYWERQDNGEWKLLRLVESEVDGSYGYEFTKPSIFEHTVMPGDTLRSLCLRYRANAVSVRRLNMFSGDNIQFKKTLLIPVEGSCRIDIQIDTPEVVIQKFRNATNEGLTESRVYLEEHSWNLEAAIQAWRTDTQWEETTGSAPPAAEDNLIGETTEDADDEDDLLSEDESDAESEGRSSMSGVVVAAAVAEVRVVAPIVVSSEYPRELAAMDIEMSATTPLLG